MKERIEYLEYLVDVLIQNIEQQDQLLYEKDDLIEHFKAEIEYRDNIINKLKEN